MEKIGWYVVADGIVILLDIEVLQAKRRRELATMRELQFNELQPDKYRWSERMDHLTTKHPQAQKCRR